MNRKIPIGTTVIISLESRFAQFFPKTFGQVIQHGEYDIFPYRVKWDNGIRNFYSDDDLIAMSNNKAAKVLLVKD